LPAGGSSRCDPVPLAAGQRVIVALAMDLEMDGRM
jgi:hypothetical protein